MNRLRDEMRRRGRHALSVANDTLSSMEITPREGGDQPGLEGESQQQEESAALREAMENLAEADQEIMHLRHISGLSFKQIAEVLQQPLGTVLARHFRAFKRLREMLGVEHED
jgi:RNA polymerase sigma-70 factor (ECF subfamily)